jgi:hypothetical protein
MADSLKTQGVEFRLWVLCLTDECKVILDALNYPEIKSYSLHEIEKDLPELQNAKKNRSIPEYYFTLSPFWPDWILKNHSELPSITYLDADLEFFASPGCLFDESGNSSIGIIEHRFHHTFNISKRYGRFNVGWVYFRRDRNASLCLAKWKAQCLEWCKDYPEDGKFADQKYLDSWPEDFQNVYVYSNPGANLGPWNLNTHEIKYPREVLLSDNRRVIFYHFHMIKALDEKHVSTSLEIYRVPVELRRKLIDWLYLPHISRLLEKEAFLAGKGFEAKVFRASRDYSKIDQKYSSGKPLDQRLEDGEVIRIR